MTGWWRRKHTGGKTVPEATGPESPADPVYGTLPGEVVGPGGPRAVTLSVLGDGVVLTADESTEDPRTYRWADVAHMWCANDVDGSLVPDGTVVTQWIHLWRLEFTDGTVVALRLADPPVATPESVFRSGRISPSAPSAIAPLLARIGDPVTELHLVRARASLAAGGQVEFGPLTATSDGLRHDGRQIPWRDITSCRYSVIIADEDESELGAMLRMEYRVEGGAYGIPFGWLRLPALEVPDMGVVVRLADENRT
ncbi:hypothetical protein [Streptomyces clavifer]|uniref:hypothetical protein n=1 Tax=Streptomyces clavifer TaxID=68188 RepID=UPI00366922B7